MEENEAGEVREVGGENHHHGGAAVQDDGGRDQEAAVAAVQEREEQEGNHHASAEKAKKKKNAGRHKTGVCYLSRIPPRMKPLKLRHLLSPHAEIRRIYLQPEG